MTLNTLRCYISNSLKDNQQLEYSSHRNVSVHVYAHTNSIHTKRCMYMFTEIRFILNVTI